jgi:hypothetical protein
MSLRQLRARLDRLEAQVPSPPADEERVARARYEELFHKAGEDLESIFGREPRPDISLTEAERIEFDELVMRFDPLAPVMGDTKARVEKERAEWEEWEKGFKLRQLQRKNKSSERSW